MDIYNNNILTTKVKLKPNEINKNYQKYLIEKLKKNYESFYTKFGLIKKDSIEILSISLGQLEQNGLEGNVVYYVKFKALVCNPVIGDTILCTVENDNNFGILCKDKEDKIIEIIIPKKSIAIISEIDLDSISIGDDIYVEILGKKSKLNDTTIRCIGKVLKTTKKNINKNNLIEDETIILQDNEVLNGGGDDDFTSDSDEYSINDDTENSDYEEDDDNEHDNEDNENSDDENSVHNDDEDKDTEYNENEHIDDDDIAGEISDSDESDGSDESKNLDLAEVDII
jgi:DNA-directed RNA polymerase subunit E'/Rpb7